MKKILISFVFSFFCGLAQCTNNGAEKIETKELCDKKNVELNFHTIIQSLKPQDQALLLNIFIDRIKFFILVLAGNDSIEKVFDDGCHLLKKKLKKNLLLLSSEALVSLDQIDAIINKKSPHYNMKLINSYMELCGDVAKKLRRTQMKKLDKVTAAYTSSKPSFLCDKVKSYFFKINVAPLNDKGKLDFDLLITDFSKSYKKMLKETNLQECKIFVLAGALLEKSESPESLKFIRNTQDYKEAKEAFDCLVETYEEFENSLTSSMKQWVPMLNCYKQVIETLCFSLKETRKEALLILKDLCLMGSPALENRKRIPLDLDNLRVLKILFTKTVQKSDGTLDNPLDDEMFKLLLSTLIKDTPGLFLLFWGNFIGDVLPGTIFDLKKITSKTDLNLAMKINQNYCLIDFLNFLISCLDDQEIELLSQEDSSPKKNNKAIKKEPVFVKTTGHRKNIFHKKNYQENNETCFFDIEKDENTTTTTTSTSCVFSPRKTEIKIEENKRDIVLDKVVKRVRRFLKKRSSDFFESGKNSVLRVRSSNCFNAFIVSQKNSENSMTISPESIDFSGTKDCDSLHKASVLAFKNENILKQCSLFDIQKTDDNTLKSLSKDFKITLQTNTAFVALLPCFIKLTRCDAKKTFKDICKKLSQKQDFNTDILGLGNHTGALAMLLEKHRFSKQADLDWYCSHLFFHEDPETKLFHQNYKK